MKTPFRASVFVAPFTAAVLALGGLALLPASAALPSAARQQAPAAAQQQPQQHPQQQQKPKTPVCVPEAGGDAAACNELVELEVHDVIPLKEAETHAVVLTTKDGQMVLPIFVDEASAVSIAFRLAHIAPPHPLAQDLLDEMAEKLGAKLVEVRIDDLRDDIYTGRIIMQQGKRQIEMGARPADSIAMALHSDARIRVTRKVLTQAGISRDEIESLRKGGPGVGGSGPGDDDSGPGIGGSGKGGGGGAAPDFPGLGGDSEETVVPPHGKEINL